MKTFVEKFISLVLVVCLLMNYSPSLSMAQEETRRVTVGETTVEYILPPVPELTLTPPRILLDPPATARLYAIEQGQPSPFQGILFSNDAAAWIGAEREMVPRYLQTYSEAITSQLVAWTYLQIDQANLRLATEMETSRLEINGLERQIEASRRLERRSRIRPVLITGLIVLSLGAVGTVSGYIIGRNN